MHVLDDLNTFYLGKTLPGLEDGTGGDYHLFPSKQLCTHAFCVGMTGSGKTGLGIDLLEEAALDGIPALLIDPKGDLSNLLLSFPGLRAQNFAPWTGEEEAAVTAERWEEGLASWGISPERIARMREKTDFALYTPGSTSGRPLSITDLFSLPSPDVLDDDETVLDLVTASVTALLGLLGLDADPLQSRPFILLSNLLQQSWQAGRSLDLPGLIEGIRNPPFHQLGAMPLDTFYPAKERFALALQLNGLLASPDFSAWMTGEPLSIDSLLWTETGKPRLSILSIAHLNDEQRMFFVTLVLNRCLSWMRAQEGTSSLRALLYMDEIFGYLPPTANPPSKKPLLTMLKQARAFGLGLVLATQNPVDLDYKALANCGTWWMGRLQTQRDRARLLDGLKLQEGNSGMDVTRLETLLAGLPQRSFVQHSIHQEAPLLFQSRHAMSYLAGPLSRSQLRQLSRLQQSAPSASPARGESPAPTAFRAPDPEGTSPSSFASAAPSLPPEVPVGYFCQRQGSLHPHLFISGTVFYPANKAGEDRSEPVAFHLPIHEGWQSLIWEEASSAPYELQDLSRQAPAMAHYTPLPASAQKASQYRVWEKEAQDFLFRRHRLSSFYHAPTKLRSGAGESEKAFALRLRQRAHEELDEELEKMKEKYRKKSESLEGKILRAEQVLEQRQSQSRQRKLDTAIAVGSTILSAFLGGSSRSRSTLGRAGTAARSTNRAAQHQGSVENAQESLDFLLDQQKELENRFQEEARLLRSRLEEKYAHYEKTAIAPLKRDVRVDLVALVWED